MRVLRGGFLVGSWWISWWIFLISWWISWWIFWWIFRWIFFCGPNTYVLILIWTQKKIHRKIHREIHRVFPRAFFGVLGPKIFPQLGAPVDQHRSQCICPHPIITFMACIPNNGCSKPCTHPQGCEELCQRPARSSTSLRVATVTASLAPAAAAHEMQPWDCDGGASRLMV